MDELKTGARNNAGDRERIRKIRELARGIHDTTLEMEPEDMPENDKQVKGAVDIDQVTFNIMGATCVKAAGDMELDVLLVPFGGPHGGKDSDGEYEKNVKIICQQGKYRILLYDNIIHQS